MSKGAERCTCTGVMAARTNGNGQCYLECTKCWNVQAITRQVDPFPTRTKQYVGKDGATRTRAMGRVPQGGTMLGPRRAH
jgi:hypothetical protein